MLDHPNEIAVTGRGQHRIPGTQKLGRFHLPLTVYVMAGIIKKSGKAAS
jgi:hypothetical protein